MIEAKNVIHHAEIDFELRAIRKHSWSGQEFVNWTREYVLEAIDKHATELTDAHQMVTLPECRINLQFEELPDFTGSHESLRKYINLTIRNALKEAILRNQTSAIPLGKYRAGFVWAFIQSGQVAGSYRPEQWRQLVKSFFDELLADEHWGLLLMKLLPGEDAFKRFYGLAGEKIIRLLLAKWLPEQSPLHLIEAVQRLIEVNPDHFLEINHPDFYQQIFRHFGGGPGDLKKVLSRIVRQQLVRKRVSRKELKVSPNDVDLIASLFDKEFLEPPEKDMILKEPGLEEIPEILGSGSYVAQAGLVLLVSFLPEFLRKTGYLDPQGKLMYIKKIPILLHYAATGETAAEEWRLTLPKVLSGLNPGRFCDTEIKPDRELDKHIDDLLNSVIEHWEALKNTSVPGLRETFLLREGVLRFINGYYYLTVEEQTVDILLSYVPWNYSTIRLDWMNYILFVEWGRQRA